VSVGKFSLPEYHVNTIQSAGVTSGDGGFSLVEISSGGGVCTEIVSGSN